VLAQAAVSAITSKMSEPTGQPPIPTKCEDLCQEKDYRGTEYVPSANKGILTITQLVSM